MSSQAWCAMLLLLGLSCAEAHLQEGEFDAGGEESAEFEGNGNEDEVARGPSSVYVMEHGFLDTTTEWMPRGTLLLSGSPGTEKKQGSFEARLSDAKEFVQMRPDLQGMMTKAVEKKAYYGIRMYSPENPQRVLQAAIPAALLAEHFEDWYDILDVTVGAAGIPVSLAYRVRHTLGLSLFDHTQVRLSQPGRAEGPRIPPRKGGPDGTGKGGGDGEDPQSPQSLLRKYWWVILIVLFLVSSMTGDDGGKGGGGGAKK